MLDRLSNLPDWIASRKILMVVLTFISISILTIVEGILSIFGGSITHFESILTSLVTLGGGGTVAQAIPDTAQAINGSYRPTSAPTSAPVEPASSDEPNFGRGPGV